VELTLPFAIHVPATSANLGPGFDVLGMALGLTNTVRVEASDQVEVLVEGEGADELPAGADNLVYRALAAVAARVGQAPPPVRLRCTNRIPLARGLGSSSAAIVAGLLAGNRLLRASLSTPDLLALATELEGHPDNVVPALLGGVRICVRSEQGLLQTRIPLARPLQAVLFIPDLRMPTAAARRVLPTMVPLADVVYNIGRVALLVAALVSGDYALLAEATRDRLHQPARGVLFPALSALLAAALEGGAQGAFLSGAGSTILALTEAESAAVAAALEAAARREGVAGRTVITTVREEGAQILP